ncbi:GTPase HflX [Microbaculum marinisediminis]|uniref:GTPase HflX n=1 Tax=Microbaculum marinisediminis TaxID=2931392 RepID=A0AAW5R4U9_9HYPH|nr:GTPase HflX [Microbaculum sp. A6E488]MCT8974159.1 GTPase HflX [Microbaculum sp. A6E488]
MKPVDPARHGRAPGRDPERASGHSTARDPTRAYVLVPVLEASDRKGRDDARGGSKAAVVRSAEARLDEAVGLAGAIDLDVVGQGVVRVAAPRPATLIGSGKVEELAAIVRGEDAELVVVDAALTPAQQRNLEKAWDAKVLDRTGLILEIFGARARTREGRLQVELAHLTWQKSRLVRSWTHLERQRGGFGFMGGPGETQIETDRRLIQERITRIEKELKAVRRTRALHRETRRRVPYPIVAIVGYTNAGKSTLFNRLTKAEVLAEDLLFATLDPTLRGLTLPEGHMAILSDTVGFISDIPTDLVVAFRATLEEVIEADLVMHVRDISHPDTKAQAADVVDVLSSLGVDTEDPRHMIEVWNKIDLIGAEECDSLKAAAERLPEIERPVPISAMTGEGVDALLAAIETRLKGEIAHRSVVLDAADGAGMNWIYERCTVTGRRHDDDTGVVRLDVDVPMKRLAEFNRRFAKALRLD